MTRIHNSGKNFELNKFSYNQYVGGKPRGFWYAIGNSWIDWCKNNKLEWVGDFNYRVLLNKTKILSIKSVKQLGRFHDKYSINAGKSLGLDLFYIDWKKVSEKYDGIEIAPFLNEINLDFKFAWYYRWDCASGCIWNLGKIKIKLL